jgi:outer membrane protein, heavy metal efflux system
MYSDRGSSSCWLRRSPRDRSGDFLSICWPRSLIAAAFAIAPLASPCAAEADAPMAGVRNAEKARVTITDARLQDAIDRRTIQRAAIERNPAVRASEQRATALKTMAKAEGGLPPPELMGQAWQVPFSRPTAFDSQMVMLGVTQSFPAPGVLAAKEQATAAQASEELAMASDKARMIMREAGRVFSDYLESSERYRLQRAQREIARHLVAVAEARHASGGALIDLTRAHVELARIQADVLSDATLIKSAKARLNALLAREPAAPLGAPAQTEPMVPDWAPSALLAKAQEVRPEIKQAQAQAEAREHAARAAEREATWPSLALGALYFPPTTAMPHHGYGVSASVSLPWLWGALGRRSQAESELARAASTNVAAARIPVGAQVVGAEAVAQTAALRVQVLRERALPASQRSFDVARAGFETGRTDLTAVLDARRAVFDVEREIIVARSDLDRALTDLEAAVGTEVPLRPLGKLDSGALDREEP